MRRKTPFQVKPVISESYDDGHGLQVPCLDEEICKAVERYDNYKVPISMLIEELEGPFSSESDILRTLARLQMEDGYLIREFKKDEPVNICLTPKYFEDKLNEYT